MKIDKLLTESYMRQMVATPRGRAHILNQIAEAEDNGEARMFDDALALVDDPKLAKMIERHRDDEIRHGRLFRECMHRTGVDPGPVPENLKVLVHLERELGGFFDTPIHDKRGVMMAYLILQVLEERALEQFGMYRRVFGELDPETGRVFDEVAEDEARHLKYCHAISRRYAPSEEVLNAELQRLRMLEARAFRATQRENMEYVREQRLMRPGPARAFWRVIGAIAKNLDFVPLTSYARAAMAEPIAQPA